LREHRLWLVLDERRFVSDIYTRMAGVSQRLLRPASEGGMGQGTIVLVQYTPGPPPTQPWEPPSAPVPVRTPLDGAVRGVGKELIGTAADNGTVIEAGDLQVIVAPWGGSAAPGDVLELDGSPATIMKVQAIPAVGITAAVKMVVRR
jgi:hypothetical protein